MLLKKFLISFILIIKCLIVTANIAEKKCGNNIFEIKIINGADLYERQFKIYYLDKDKIKRIAYKTEIGMGLDAGCLKNKEGKYLLLFREFCSGNACPENIYGLFDIELKKIILNPSDWPYGNSKQVEKLTGFLEVDLFKNEYYFCCDKELYGNDM